MRRVVGVLLLVFCTAPFVLADTEDTTVFRVRMLPENEVPAVPIIGASADAVITVRATRDIRGVVTAATVIFEIDYTVPSATTFTGLHIHNGPAGVNAGVVVPTTLSAAKSPTGLTGRYVEAVDVASNRLVNISGLWSSPHLYYVNIHSTTYPGGIMRAQLQRNKLSLRPALKPANEVPAITDLNAQGAALIHIAVERDATGAITSGNVTFDVDYLFPGSVTINGLHIHKAAAGVSGDVVISSGITSSTSITNTTGRGNIFRVADIAATNTVGVETLKGLLADPTGYYVNLHTTDHPGGAIRGQLELDTLNFRSRMVAAEENPPTDTTGYADALSTIKVTRDTVGNVNGGTVEFNIDYNFPGAVTFTGLHIHNGRIGVNAGVVLGSNLSGSNPVVDDDGVGTINRQFTIPSTDTRGVPALGGLFFDPEAYYINLHSTVNSGGVVRAQLARETYHFRPTMSPSNEIPAITSTATATAWMTIKIARSSAGAITSGTVTFDVNYTLAAAEDITGLHIHRGSAVANGSVVISSGISGSSPVAGSTAGNITRTAEVTSASGLEVLADLIKNPNGFYVNLHTTSQPGGLMRSQLLQFLNYFGQVAGGGDWITSLTIKNPSSTAGVHGQVNFNDTEGDPLPVGIIDPNMTFWIPPSGSVTFNTHNKGAVETGNARIYSNAVVNVDAGYFYPGLTSEGRAKSVVANSISIPVSIGSDGVRNTAVAFLNLESAPVTVLLTLRDTSGAVVAGGTNFFVLDPGEHGDAFVTELFPALGVESVLGTLTVEVTRGPIPSGLIVALALQFETTSVTPVTISVIN